MKHPDPGEELIKIIVQKREVKIPKRNQKRNRGEGLSKKGKQEKGKWVGSTYISRALLNRI